MGITRKKSVRVDLQNIGNGVLNILFETELRKILANIADPNTSAKKTRSLSITVTIKPNDNRSVADISIQALSKFAPTEPKTSAMFLELNDDGEIEAYQIGDAKQPNLPLDEDVEPAEPKAEENITNINRRIVGGQ